MRLIKRTRFGIYLDKMEASFVRSVKSIFSLLLVPFESFNLFKYESLNQNRFTLLSPGIISAFKNCFRWKRGSNSNTTEVKMEEIVVVEKSQPRNKRIAVKNQEAANSVGIEQANEEPPKRSIFSKLRHFIRIVAKSNIFFFIMMIVITVNMGVLAASGSYYVRKIEDEAEILNYVCAIIYNVELVINVAGLGPYHYFENKFQLLDLCCVIILDIDSVYNVTKGQRIAGFTILKCLSLMRLIKRTRFGIYLDKMEASFVRSVKSIFSLLLVLLLVLVIYALLGNRLFNKYTIPLHERVGSFKNTKDSMLLVFVLLTGEGWPNIMSGIVKAYGQDHKKGSILVPLTYFISFILFANFILLNIFLGIMIDNLTAEAGVTFAGKHKSSDQVVNEKPLNEDTRKQVCKNMYQTPLNVIVEADENETEKSSMQQDGKKIIAKGRRQNKKATDLEANKASKTKPKTNNINKNSNVNKAKTARSQRVSTRRTRAFNTPSGKQRRLSGVEMSMSMRPEFIEKGPQHKSLFIFGPKNPVRVICHKLATNKWFQYVCLVSIIISTVILAFEDPLNRDLKLAKALLYCDYLFTGKTYFKAHGVALFYAYNI